MEVDVVAPPAGLEGCPGLHELPVDSELVVVMVIDLACVAG